MERARVRWPRFGSCDEGLLGVLRDGRLVLLGDVGGELSTVRVVGRSGLGATTIGRARVSGLSPYSARLSTDRRVVLWESSPNRRGSAAWSASPCPPGGAWRTPARTGDVYPYSDFDRAGGRLLVRAAVGPGGVREVLLVGRAGPGPRRRIPTPRSSVGPRLSPDRRRVAYIVRGRIVVRSVRGGSPRTLTPASSGAADGRWFAGGVPPGVRVGWGVRSLSWSPDGHRIAAVVGFESADLSAAIVSVRADGVDLRPLAVRSGAVEHVVTGCRTERSRFRRPWRAGTTTRRPSRPSASSTRRPGRSPTSASRA